MESFGMVDKERWPVLRRTVVGRARASSRTESPGFFVAIMVRRAAHCARIATRQSSLYRRSVMSPERGKQQHQKGDQLQAAYEHVHR
jgi:hypothetical protein